MLHRTMANAAALLALLLFALPTSSLAEERFGPWVYYAPYYFPPDKSCLGHCFGPDDFASRYESPNPPQPPNNVPPPAVGPPPQPMRKVAPGGAKGAHARLEPPPSLAAQGSGGAAVSGAAKNRTFSATQTISGSASSAAKKPINAPRAANPAQPRLVNPPAPGSQGHSM